jgi:hypothetical protein
MNLTLCVRRKLMEKGYCVLHLETRREMKVDFFLLKTPTGNVLKVKGDISLMENFFLGRCLY